MGSGQILGSKFIVFIAGHMGLPVMFSLTLFRSHDCLMVASLRISWHIVSAH